MDSPSPFLVIPHTRESRWRLIEEVIAQWYPAGSGQAVPSGNAPPSPPETHCAGLQEWYAFVRRQPGIWCRQDSLFCCHFYERNKDYLIIGVENQACALWGVRRDELSFVDPPVYLDPAANGCWLLESPTVSEFAVTWLAASIKWSDHNRCWANGPASESALQIVTSHYSRLGLADWHCPQFPTRFYGTTDLLLEIHCEANDKWFWLATRTEEAFRQFLSRTADEVEWEASSDEWPAGWVSSSHDAG